MKDEMITTDARSITERVDRLAGGYGTYIFKNTARHNVNFGVITPLGDDVVIAELYLDGETDSVITTAEEDSPYNIATLELTTADLITAPANRYFTGIKLTSGTGVRLN